MKTAVVRARIEEDLKEEAERILAQHGLQMSNAIRIFLHQVARQGGLPFELRSSPPQPVTGKHLRAIKRAQQARDHARAGKRPDDVGSLLIRPHRARDAQVKWPKASLRDEK
jgi:DNA-damage-inducible protein J